MCSRQGSCSGARVRDECAENASCASRFCAARRLRMHQLLQVRKACAQPSAAFPRGCLRHEITCEWASCLKRSASTSITAPTDLESSCCRVVRSGGTAVEPKHTALHPATSEGAGSLWHGSHPLEAAILHLALRTVAVADQRWLLCCCLVWWLDWARGDEDERQQAYAHHDSRDIRDATAW